MRPILSPSESILLRYLYEHSAGRGERIALDPKSVLRALRIGKERLEADTASLSAIGLVGTRRFRSDSDSPKPTEFSAVWITGAGENFLSQRRFTPGAASGTTAVAGSVEIDEQGQ
jgi:hypothetical protein